jgi:hypothetical protein
MRRNLPRDGDKRVIRKFLWLPLEIDRDWRWLEWAWIEQEFWVSTLLGYRWWTNVRFVDGAHGGSWQLAPPPTPSRPPIPPADIDPGSEVGGW